MYFDDANINLLALVVAHTIEETVALGRQFGMRFPKEYAVGFLLKEHTHDPGVANITMRLNTIRRTYVDRWVFGLDGGGGFLDTLQREAAQLVHRWGNSDPMFKPNDDALARLVASLDDPIWRGAVHDRARASMTNAKFTVRR